MKTLGMVKIGTDYRSRRREDFERLVCRCGVDLLCHKWHERVWGQPYLATFSWCGNITYELGEDDGLWILRSHLDDRED